MSYPDFVCMGFQKCGTTTLYDLLKQHPQIVLCQDVKEPMLYRVPVMHLFGRSFYRKRYFGHVSPTDGRLKGEINAGLTYTNCEKWISKDYSPDTKMIFMLRDPVSRSYSAYKYFLARGFLGADAVNADQKLGHAAAFDQYVHSILDDPKKRDQVMKKRLRYMVLSQSNYGQSIEEYLSDFSSENMKFIVFEEFIRDQHKGCREIYEFLGVDDPDDILYDMRSNEGKEKPRSAFWARAFWYMKGINYGLFDFLMMPHWGKRFYDWFRRQYKTVRDKALLEDTDKSAVLPETRAYLQAYFLEDVKQAERLTGKKLRGLWNWDGNTTAQIHFASAGSAAATHFWQRSKRNEDAKRRPEAPAD